MRIAKITCGAVLFLVGVGLSSVALGEELDCPVIAAGGAVHSDGTLLVLGQTAGDDVSNGSLDVVYGAVPCWIAAPAPCIGDLNGDSAVDLTDLAFLLSDFDCSGGGCSGDVDGDGDTDLTDLAFLLAAFDTICN